MNLYNEDEISSNEVIATSELLETASSYSYLNVVRHEQELQTLNALEKASYRNVHAHMKKFKPRNFTVGERVLFRRPLTFGMVTTINVVGEVCKLLLGHYYKLKEGASLHCFTMVPYLGQDNATCGAEHVNTTIQAEIHYEDEVTATRLKDEIITFASAQKE